MSVSASLFGKLSLVSMVAASLAGCAGGVNGINLPGSSSSQSTTPQVQSSATDIASAGQIVDDATRIVLTNPKKINGYCPSVSILGETNVVQTYAKGGDGNAQQLIYQASISQTARECTTLGAEMFIKVGVAGRVLGGPKSDSGTKATLPLRIVVRQNDDVLYTKLHKISVVLNTPDRSALFAKVDEGVAIPAPQDRNVQILVGFDPGSKR